MTVTAVLVLMTAVSAAAQCVSDVQTISTRQSAPNLVAGPVAWGNGIAAVAKLDPVTSRLFVGTYDANFTPLGDRLIDEDATSGAPVLVSNGNGFGLFYRTDSRRLVLQRLNAAGEPLGTPIPVSSRTIEFDEDVDATWSDALNAYVVASTVETRSQVAVWVTVLDRDGIVQRDVNTFVFASLSEPSLNVAVTGDGVIGAFYRSADEQTIVGIRILRDGTIHADTVWTAGHDLNVTAFANRFYLVKSAEFVAGQREIRWLALDSAGTIVVSDRTLLRVSDLDLQPMALINNGTELALTYREGLAALITAQPSFRIHRFTPAGTTIADSLVAAAHPPQRFAWSAHDFVWTGSAYVSTAVFAQGRELDSLLLRLCPLKAAITTPRTIYTSDEFITFTASAEGGVPGYTYTWSPGNASATFGGPTFRYRYIHNGTFVTTLTVTDDAGVSTTTAVVVHIVERKKRAVRK